jgi:hypothetical protein
MIRYKVVREIKKGKRVSAYVNKEEYELSIKYYELSYPVGKIVKSPKDTLGIFTFKTKKQAKAWMRGVFFTEEQVSRKIIKVKPVKRGITPKWIASGLVGIEKFYKYGLGGTKTCWPPVGTVCYPAVKVLE